jgi:hypothetical protein
VLAREWDQGGGESKREEERTGKSEGVRELEGVMRGRERKVKGGMRSREER